MKSKLPLLCLGVALFSLVAPPIQAAAITWGTPHNITSDSDVSTNGTLICAVDWNNANQTVNGVPFVPATPNMCIQGLNAILVDNNTTSGYGVGLPSSPSLSTAYGNILATSYLSTGTMFSGNSYGYGTITVVMNGLTPGHQYQVQVWCQDPRQATTTQTITDIAGNTNTVTVALCTGAVGTGGQYVTGTFTADSPIAANGNQPAAQQGFIIQTSGEYMEVNAVQLRDLTPGGTVLTPYFSPSTQTKNSGATPVTNSLYGAQSVVITSETAGSTIYYTTNGTTPTINSLHGTNGTGLATAVLSTNTVIQAIGAMNGCTNSSVSSATYYILPVPTNQMNGLQDWKSMKYGMMVTYAYNSPNYGTGNFETPNPDGSHTQGIDNFANEFNATQFASDLASFGLQYVIFTAWHGGECPLYPSAVMNSWRPGCCPSRDLLGDMIDACHAKGIKVIFYTHPLLGHNYNQVDDATTGYWPWNWVTWSNFKNDEYSEMVQRYGSRIDGFYTDDGFQAGNLDGAASAGVWYPINALFTHDNLEDVDYVRLRGTIKSANTNMVTMCNGSYSFRSSYAFDYPNVEQGGLPGTTYSDGGNFCAQSIQIAPVWWATVASTGSWACTASASNIFQYTVLGAGTSGSFGGAAWAAGCYDSSGWEPGVAQTMQQVGAWIAPISNSIDNTYASSSYVTGAGNSVGSVSYGIVATKSTNNLIEYIHVLNPPSSKTLNLPAPADGKSFSSAILLANGQPVTLLQNGSGVNLTLTGTNSWSSLDTVIALSVAGTPPTIFNVLTTTSAITGSTASFSAVALGATGYQWQAGPAGGPYTNLVNGGQISGATNATLNIANLSSNNALSYQLVASNSYGSVTNTAGSLTVLPSTELIDVQVGNGGGTQTGAAVLGASGDLWNNLTGNSSAITNTTGLNQPGVSVSLNNFYSLNYAVGLPSDSGTAALMSYCAYQYPAQFGNWTVSISGLNPYVSEGFSLVIYGAGPGSGGTYTLSGAAYGNSTNTLTTTAASAKLSAGIGVAYQTFTGILTNGTLTITGASPGSFPGINGFQLKLMPPTLPPAITNQPTSVTNNWGSTVIFSAGVYPEGSQVPSYQWYYDTNTLITGATNASLILTNVSSGGTYDVVITNAYGSVTSSIATLTVSTAPQTLSIANNSFENPAVATGGYFVGTLPGWNFSGSSAVMAAIDPGLAGSSEPWPTNPVPGVDATNFAQIFITAAGGSGTVYQDTGIQYHAGVTYTLSAAIGLATNGTFAPGSMIVLYNSSLVPIASNVISSSSLTSGAFTNVSLSYTATGNEAAGSGTYGTAGDVIVGFSSPSSASGAYFDVDNVQLVATPPTPPSISNQPASLYTGSGNTASFQVTALGAGPLSYKWYYDTNTPVSGGTNATLTLTNVQTTNTGTYDVVVSNSYGATTSSIATLTVATGPQSIAITNNSFENPTVAAGNYEYTNLPGWSWSSPGSAVAAIIHPGLSGSSEPWPTNPVSGVDGSNFCQIYVSGSGGSGTLYQDTGVKYQAGVTYTLAATFGLQTNSPIAPGSTVVFYNSSLTPIASNVISSSSLASGAFTKISFNYTATGSEAVGSGTYGTSGDVIIGFSTPSSSSGSYFDFDNVQLTMGPPPPSITNQPVSSITTNLGSTVTLSVGATSGGTNQLTYQWYFDSTTAVIGGTNATLTLTNVQTSGTYDVVVTDQNGSTTSQYVTLTLLGAPIISSQPTPQSVYAINTVTLSVGVSGATPLSYQWQGAPAGSSSFTNLPNAGQISGATSNLLTLTDANTNFTGNYRVIVTNNVGSVTSTVTPLTVQGGWQLVWSDDFNGTNLDSTKWSAYVGNDTGGQNNYTSSTSNVSVSGGLLHITAQYNGSSYTSGQVRSEFKYAKKYGRIEARMKLPAGQGFWPAFWMLGTNYDYPTSSSLNWPWCGEIDVLENAGGNTSQVQGTLHYPDASGNDTFVNTTLPYTFPSGTDTTSFHTYAIQWTSNSITWQIDGQNLTTWSSLPSDGLTPFAPFNQPFFILLDLAVSSASTYGGAPNSSTPFPSEVQVDYVRVYDVPTPTVSLVTPTNGAAFVLPTNVPLTVSVTNNGTTVTQVSFYQNGTNLIGSSYSSPYTLNWTNPSVGNYSITAQVSYTSNGTSTSTVTSAASAITVYPAGSVPLANASFEADSVAPGNYETASLTAWNWASAGSSIYAVIAPGTNGTVEAWPTVPVSGLDGTNFCQIFETGTGGGTVYQDSGVKYVAGTTYTLSASFGLQTNGTFATGSTLVLYNSSLTPIASKVISTTNLVAGTFTTNINVTYTATGNEAAGNGTHGTAGDVIIGFTSPSSSASGSYFDFDNAHLKLTAPTAPSITTQPVSKTTNAGSSVSFSVVASGTMPLSYQWYFNTNTPVSGGTNASATLTNVQTSGTYDVVVTGPGGIVTSSIANLTVLPNPPASLTGTPGVNSVVLTYPAAANAKFYTVYRSKVSGGPYTKIASTTALKYTDVNVVAGTTYYYVLTSNDGTNPSAYSTQASATPHR